MPPASTYTNGLTYQVVQCPRYSVQHKMVPYSCPQQQQLLGKAKVGITQRTHVVLLVLAWQVTWAHWPQWCNASAGVMVVAVDANTTKWRRNKGDTSLFFVLFFFSMISILSLSLTESWQIMMLIVGNSFEHSHIHNSLRYLQTRFFFNLLFILLTFHLDSHNTLQLTRE